MPSSLAVMISDEVGVAGSAPAGRFGATGKVAMRLKNGAASAGDGGGERGDGGRGRRGRSGHGGISSRMSVVPSSGVGRGVSMTVACALR